MVNENRLSIAEARRWWDFVSRLRNVTPRKQVRVKEIGRHYDTIIIHSFKHDLRFDGNILTF